MQARTVGPTLKRHLPLSPVLEVSCLCGLLFPFFLLYMFIVGSVQGFFSPDFSFSLRFLEVSHVEGSSLPTSLRYQIFLFCNQRASARLVIRRAVEIESHQLNLWYLGLVWFIVTFHDVPFQ